MELLPRAFLDRLREIIPEDDLDDVLRSFGEPRDVGFRVNTLRASLDDVLGELTAAGLHPERVEDIPEALIVPYDERSALLDSPAAQENRIYVQDLASQLVIEILDPQPDERILDLCAAPGSKTGQIAARMNNDGEIAAVEAVRPRFFRMRANLESQGADTVRTFHRDGSTVWRHRPDYFDRVLVDAPCSTEGRFRTDDPNSTRFWHPKKNREMARKQFRLLESGLKSLRPGGTLVYSTCTFAPEENEGVLDRIFQQFDGEIYLEELSLPDWCRPQIPLTSWKRNTFSESVQHARRLLPTRFNEAFFVVRLRRRD